MTAKRHFPTTNDVQPLLEAFEPAMLGMLPGEGDRVHAETLLALCLADGVLEVLEWAREGTGADPTASMWLAGLRWYRLITGDFPEGAPQPQPRPTDYALRRIMETGGLALTEGSAEDSLAGLASAEMSLVPRPRGVAELQNAGEHQAEDGGSQCEQAAGTEAKLEARLNPALARVLPVGLTPYVELGMKLGWAQQAVFLTHQNPELLADARRLAAALHSDVEASHVYGTLLSQSAGKDGGRASDRPHELLAVVVEDLAQRWRDATGEELRRGRCGADC